MTALTEACGLLSEIIDEVAAARSDLVITEHSRPAAVLIGYEEYESLLETLEIPFVTETMTALAEAERGLARARPC